MEIDKILTNYTQTPISERIFKGLDHNSKSSFFEFFMNIELIQNMVSVDRKRARDLPRDKKGRIIVSLENPHILEDMDYFTERANFFRKHGRYTDLFPNPAPGSAYRKFWDEERRRCKEGYIRESDGEWISGYFYFYINYSPILKVEKEEEYFEERITYEDIIEDTLDDFESGLQAERVEDFPDIYDGDYLFFHYVDAAERSGQHGTVLKTRGRGYSFKGGSMLVRNYFMYMKSRSYAFASETEYLTKDGILTKAWANMNFIDNHTAFSQPREYKDTDFHKRASYKDTTKRTESGFMSEVMGVTCKNEPSKGRGKRGKLLFFDESGIFPGLKKTWAVARKSVEQGRYVYGHMLTAGTGGEQGSDFEAAEAFFYFPLAFNIKAIRNVFDINGTGTCGFYSPEYLNRQGCYDKDGNSDIVKALIEIMHQRQKVRVATNDPNDLIQEKAEASITPQESVLRTEGSLFPIQDLKDYLAEISVDLKKFLKPHYAGRLKVSPDGVIDFVMQEEAHPVRDYPVKDNMNKQGAVEIFELPVRGSDGYIPSYRYIMGVDTYDDDHSQTNSLGSAFVFDRWTDRIVAEYTGRPATANEFYEIVLRLAKFYNAIINYENDKKGLYGYFFNKNQTHMLCDNPEILGERDLAKIGANYGNKKKGTQANKAVNAWGRRLQADWLIESVQGYEEEDEEGNPIVAPLNLQKLRSIGYIKELIAWNPEINADRVSAMNMVMVLREEIARFEVLGENESYEPTKDIFNDKFFDQSTWG